MVLLTNTTKGSTVTTENLINRVKAIREDAYLTATYLGDEHVGDLLTEIIDALDSEWEYGTRRAVTDGWESGDRFSEHEYIDSRSISDKVSEDRSSNRPGRDMSRAVRRRKAGPWEKM